MIVSFSCRHTSEENQPAVNQLEITPEELQTEIKIFGQDGGWGYDVFVNGEKYIHQPAIPAINGLKPFKTEEDATKVAQLVEQKIKGNLMPPTVTMDELQLLGIDME